MTAHIDKKPARRVIHLIIAEDPVELHRLRAWILGALGQSSSVRVVDTVLADRTKASIRRAFKAGTQLVKPDDWDALVAITTAEGLHAPTITKELARQEREHPGKSFDLIVVDSVMVDPVHDARITRLSEPQPDGQERRLETPLSSYALELKGEPPGRRSQTTGPEIYVAWDAGALDAKDYAELVSALSELARAHGAAGIQRVRSLGVEVENLDRVPS